jgi:hypothetical protein
MLRIKYAALAVTCAFVTQAADIRHYAQATVHRPVQGPGDHKR